MIGHNTWPLTSPAGSNGSFRLGVGFEATALTPYCLRRGGASWHFLKYGSYDLTQALGRWQQQKTARQYIDQALAEIGLLQLPPWGRTRLERAAPNLRGAFLKWRQTQHKWRLR